jgi:hypothetical protein
MSESWRLSKIRRGQAAAAKTPAETLLVGPELGWAQVAECGVGRIVDLSERRYTS